MIVALFQASLDVDADALATLAAALSPAEQARAEARRDERERRRFTADHGWRRRLLAARIGCAPETIEYTLGERGKPRLTSGGSVRFSASRADGMALYALSDVAEVGVDIEAVDPDRDLAALARRLLSASERAVYEALPAAQRPAALYACWTRKEAHAKALGTGLVFPLAGATVWCGDVLPMREGEALVGTVELAPGLAGAIAVAAPASGGAGEEPELPRVPETVSLYS